MELESLMTSRLSAEPLPATADDRCRTGCTGLDNILNGGFTPHRLYLIEGTPGSGKTTLALQFLLEGARLGETVLYVTLSETEHELRAVMASHGWSPEGLQIRELLASQESLLPDEQYTMFHPSEVELSETTKSILDEVERIRPARVVFDSLSEMRLLAGNALRYRRQILALKQFFRGRHCTVLLLDDMTSTEHDLQVQSIAHGVLRLEQMYPEYGIERRRMQVAKFRGTAFRGGYHDYLIQRGGMVVFPRLIANESRAPVNMQQLSSGLPQFDSLLGGGIERGTSTLLMGAAGTGKSTIAAQLSVAAAQRGEIAAIFLFDESLSTVLKRTSGLGIHLQPFIDQQKLIVQQVDPAELTPGQFVHLVRETVLRNNLSVLVIDSLNGYLNAMPNERFLVIQLHELLTFLGQAGVASILIAAQQGLIGNSMQSPIDASYLADSVILLRYFEAMGEVRQAISVLKKRTGPHERTIREFRMTHGRIDVGPQLNEFRGVLTGVPNYRGDGVSLGGRSL
jgi:circadian clock protein KaiC